MGTGERESCEDYTCVHMCRGKDIILVGIACAFRADIASQRGLIATWLGRDMPFEYEIHDSALRGWVTLVHSYEGSSSTRELCLVTESGFGNTVLSVVD